MATKKGSKEWKSKVSKAQKVAWKKRRAIAVAKSYTVKNEVIEPGKEAAPPPDERQVLSQWINSASSTEERAKRKAAMMGIMYGTSADSFASTISPESQTAWRNQEDIAAGRESVMAMMNHNPKTLMGDQKVPVLSVVPPASIIAQATAMRYGAFFATKIDGTKGYGPYNWRDQPIEAHIYIDAAMRHLMQWFDGDECEIIRDAKGRAIDEVSHLAFALATIGILLDAKANGTLIDDRPRQRQMAASDLLRAHKLPRYDDK